MFHTLLPQSFSLLGVRLLVSLLGGGSPAAASTEPVEPVAVVAAPESALTATAHTLAAAVRGEPTWDLSNLDHERVDTFVEMFSGRKHDEFAGFLARSGRYAPMIAEKLEARGMPQDLLYLAMIESGFRPEATSPAKAAGLWQFIPETGQRYGLEINKAVDERRDPEQATDAALDYLQDLHDRFDSWYLAAASYNTGENRVGRIMKRETGSEKGTDADYYAIWDHLPRETRDYVPLMIAAGRIAKEPAKYGFGDVVLEAPDATDTVMVPPGTSLEAVAKTAGTTVDEIERLNPHLRIDRTRNDRADTVRVPAGQARLTRISPTKAG